jgi:hypothetical protein
VHPKILSLNTYVAIWEIGLGTSKFSSPDMVAYSSFPMMRLPCGLAQVIIKVKATHKKEKKLNNICVLEKKIKLPASLACSCVFIYFTQAFRFLILYIKFCNHDWYYRRSNVTKCELIDMNSTIIIQSTMHSILIQSRDIEMHPLRLIIYSAVVSPPSNDKTRQHLKQVRRTTLIR